MMLLTVLTFLGLHTAAASTTVDHLTEARAALAAANYDEASSKLDQAEAAAPEATRILPARLLAQIWLYRGILAHLQGESDETKLELWRLALVIDSELPWDDSILDDEVQSIFEALRQEVRNRPVRDVGVPEATGAAKAYLDGERRVAGDEVLAGMHLAQIECPGGEIVGRWTELDKPLRWLRLCPEKVDTTVVVEEETTDDSDWAAFGPNFGDTDLPDDDLPTEIPDLPPAETTPLIPEKTVSPLALRASLAQAEGAFIRRDADALNTASEQAHGQLPALTELISVPDAAAFHRMNAMVAWTAGDRDQTVLSYRAAVVSEPSYMLPSEVTQPDQALDEAFQEARGLGSGGSRNVYVPQGINLYVDGQTATERSETFGSIVQITDLRGDLQWTGYLGQDDPNPNWRTLGITGEVIAAEPDSRFDWRSPSRSLLWASGGSAVLSGVVYAMAVQQRAVYDDITDDPINDLDTLEAQRTRTNATVVVSAGLGAAAVGLGFTAFTGAR